MERLNFASEQLGNPDNPGVKSIVGSVVADGEGAISPERLVDRSLDQLGALSRCPKIPARSLIEYASQGGDLDSSVEPDEKAQQRGDGPAPYGCVYRRVPAQLSPGCRNSKQTPVATGGQAHHERIYRSP